MNFAHENINRIIVEYPISSLPEISTDAYYNSIPRLRIENLLMFIVERREHDLPRLTP